MRRQWLALVLTIMVGAASVAARAEGPAAGTGESKTASEARPLDPRIVRESVERWSERAGEVRTPAPPRAARFGKRTRVALIVAGSVVGMVAGAAGGYVIEERYFPCFCADAGVTSARFGAVLGAVVGGGLTALFTR